MSVILDDTSLPNDTNIEIVNPAGRRELTHVIHDIDGTHSLIRDWPPVMSLVIHWAMTSGLEENFDSDTNLKELIKKVGKDPLDYSLCQSPAQPPTIYRVGLANIDVYEVDIFVIPFIYFLDTHGTRDIGRSSVAAEYQGNGFPPAKI